MRIPLFPLNVVLFPGGYLPLHIFEPRYRLMMRHCLDGDRRFGVVLINSGSEVGEPATPEMVGTIANIDEAKTLEDGRMVIGVEGEKRFRIVKIFDQLPYITADVTLMEDDGSSRVNETLTEEVRLAAQEHLQLLIGLSGEHLETPRVPADPIQLRYSVGSQLQGEVIGKQGVLEMEDTTNALRLALRLLNEETLVLRGRMRDKLGGSSAN